MNEAKDAMYVMNALIGVGSVIVAIAGSFFYVKFKTHNHDEKLKAIEDWQNKHSDSNELKINGGFKRLDEVITRITIIETDTNEYLKLREAEEKFVTKLELQLQLENIALSTSYTQKEVDKIEGKLDDILSILNDKRS